MAKKDSIITLSHGSGGIESQKLITELFYHYLEGCVIGASEDAGVGEIKTNVPLALMAILSLPSFFPVVI